MTAYRVLVPIFFISLLVGCRQEVDIASQVVGVGEDVSSEVQILTWSEYIAPSVKEAFEKETGIKVVETAYDNQEEVYALLEAANYKFDLVITPKAMVKRLMDRGGIRNFDMQRLEGLENLNAKFRSPDVDPKNEFTLPYFWGSTLIAYRSDLVPFTPEPSLQVLFDKRLKGKTAILTDHLERYALANKFLGKTINERSPEQLKRASSMLGDYVKEHDGQFLGDQEIRDQLKSGELWLAHCYNGDAEMIARDEPAIRYFLPQEGAGLWVDLIVMTREARNAGAAYTFLNFLNRPEVTAENANFTCFAPPNDAAIKLLDPSLLKNEAVFPPEEVLAKCEFHATVSPEVIAVMSELSRDDYRERADREVQ